MRTTQQQLVENELTKSIKQQMDKPKIANEVLTKKDLEELMGYNMPTYRRIGGSIKRKR